MRYNITVTDFAEKYPEMFKSFMRLQFWLDEVTLATYFGPNDNAELEGTYWSQQTLWATRKTGQQLLDKLIALDPKRICDVGCGDNEFKPHFGDKLIGIDPYNPKSDFKIGINEYTPDHIAEFDIVLALGSINFGDTTEIERQIGNVIHLVKPGGKIFWRCNPGITHDNAQAQWVDFFLGLKNTFMTLLNESIAKLMRFLGIIPRVVKSRCGAIDYIASGQSQD